MPIRKYGAAITCNMTLYHISDSLKYLNHLTNKEKERKKHKYGTEKIFRSF